MTNTQRFDARDDRDAIIAIFTKMAAAMDRKDWEAYESIFTEDAVADFIDQFHRIGRPKVVQLVREVIDACGPTHHLIGNFDISIDGDKAVGSCNVRAHHCGKGDKAHLFQESLGTFTGTFRRTGEGWRMAHLQERVPIMLGTIEIFPTPSP